MNAAGVVARASQSKGILSGPIIVEDDFFREVDLETLFLYGIFNPMGPTFNMVTLASSRPDQADGVRLLCYRMLNPFATDSFVFGSGSSDAEIMETLTRFFSEDGFPEHPLFGSLPTWILPVARREPFRRAVLAIVGEYALNQPADLLAIVRRYEKFRGQPWDRLSADTADHKAGIAIPPAARQNEMPDMLLWIKTLLDEEHQSAEIAASIVAWQGALDFQARFGNKGGAPLDFLWSALGTAGLHELDPIFESLKEQKPQRG